MKKTSLLLVFCVFTSCIPLQIAPNIDDYKIRKARKFKRKLPMGHAFIFNDPKDANEFYHFVNIKYQAQGNAEHNVPFHVDDKTYYLSFYETEKNTSTVNLIPIIVDAALEEKGHDPYFEDIEYTRSGKWYLALFVTDSELNDCLHPGYETRDKIAAYLEDLRQEYLNTHNYYEAWLKKNE
ncbi:hypothetical protein GWK08_15340 [Leptobacterium flavescens]|uniref:Uncharacterized protein n=1 Tax=Leptobacterium flavescens TaxID=472055 RepID=A0A6P0UQR6_9FLAO|nr:hypothetical protein [Leptobacterium flavescens]NER14830.1 hypothetical protein [Leptobacterium flavescens]